MKIIYPINIHLDRREPCPILDAVQGENGRAVAVSLFEKGQPWNIPAGAYALIRYARPDACGGIYDTLPGGAPACGIQGNTVTAQLTAQALAVAGMVSVQLAIVYEEVQLATFIFLVRVESDPSAGTAAARRRTLPAGAPHSPPGRDPHQNNPSRRTGCQPSPSQYKPGLRAIPHAGSESRGAAPR